MLAGYAVGDLVFWPRLAADADGLVIRIAAGARPAGLGRGRRRPRRRRAAGTGCARSTLEIDAGDALVVFSRRALGADPATVRELVASAAVADARDDAGESATGGGADRDHDDDQHEQPAQPGRLQPGAAPAARTSAARRSPAPASTPVTKPPMCPSFEMPATENVKTKLMTMMPTSYCRSRPSRRTSTRQAPNSPKIAPDAPTTGTRRRAEGVDRAPTAERESRYTRANRHRPISRSSAGPMKASDSMFDADVQQVRVQERRREQPVVAAVVVHRVRQQLPVLEQPRDLAGLVAARAADCSAGDQVDDDVERDSAIVT